MKQNKSPVSSENQIHQGGHAVAVLIVTPQGIPLIRDPKKPAPVFWKAPGGRGGANETAKSAAAREVREETGLVLSEDNLEPILEENRGSHILTLFIAKLPSLPPLKDRGDEGEEIRAFPAKEVLSLPDFFPNHKRAYEKILRSL
jgi:ADP-ribose pyrophosphatase YjhB (NUDIX family)